MRKLVAISQLSVDGVMQAPGGPEEDTRGGFTHGGWAMPYFDDAMGQAVLGKTIAGDFDLLLGRRTYEIFAAYWPQQGEDPVGKAFNKATKFVATGTLDRFSWENTRKINGEAAGGVRRLKASEGPELHVWGSGELLQTLMTHGLVDEYRLWVFPLVLGKGRRLFKEGLPAGALTLVESQSTPKGVLLNTYRPAGK